MRHRYSTAAPRYRRAVRAVSVLAVTAGAVLPASAASAASTSASAYVVNSDVLHYTAAAGQTNKLKVTEALSADHKYLVYDITDDVSITAGADCSYPDASVSTEVVCQVEQVDTEDPYTVGYFSLGDGNDTFGLVDSTSQGYYTNNVEAGTGNDTVADQATGVYSGDTVYGNSGNDKLTVSSGAVAYGGDGADTLYADDENDKAMGADLHGGPGSDVLHGGTLDDSLYGDAGSDTLYGGASADSLYGGTGNDTLYGNSGNDTLYGNSGNDTLYGGPGAHDVLSGGSGSNRLHQD